MRKIDLIGQKFGRLTIVRETEERSSGDIVWECLCECGNTIKANGKNIRKGRTKSCGCYGVERLVERSKTHGMSNTREFKIWKNMIKRCKHPETDWCKYYAGRNISVCERWTDFALFYEDMGPCPDGFSIERLNYDAGYSPDNCVWADWFTQAKNRRMFRNNTSGVVGVSWIPQKQKWFASIGRKNKVYRLGHFDKFEDAAAARRAAEQVLDLRSLSDTSMGSQQSAA